MGPCKRWRRKGISAVQTALLIGAIAIAVIIGVQSVGTSTREGLNRTAGDVGNPSNLVGRFGSSGTSGGDTSNDYR